MVEERLSVFEDEPDLNDWVEVMCGAAMVVLGVFHLVEPGNLVDPDIMRWFAAAVVAAAAVVGVGSPAGLLPQMPIAARPVPLRNAVEQFAFSTDLLSYQRRRRHAPTRTRARSQRTAPAGFCASYIYSLSSHTTKCPGPR